MYYYKIIKRIQIKFDHIWSFRFTMVFLKYKF